MVPQTLKILQHNVLSWTFHRRNELYNMYRQEDPDVVLINSHGRRNDEKVKLFGYTVYQRNYRNEAHDGVAIAIKQNITHQVIDDLEENYLGMIISTTLGPICIGTGYQPPRRPRIPVQNILNITRRNMPAYIIGDLNARHLMFNHRSTNPSGRMLYDMVREGHLSHLGPDFQTFIGENGSGTPDIVVSNSRDIHNIQIRPGKLTTSDHLPVIVTLSSSPIQVPAPLRYNLHQANWEAFQEDLSLAPAIDLDGQPAEEINTQMHLWFATITQSMERHIPRTQYRTLPHPRTTEEIRQIQTQYQTLQRQAHTHQWTRERRQQLITLQQQLQQICKRERDAHWNSLLTEIEADYRDPAKFWRNIRRLMGGCQQHIPYIQDEQGNKLYTDQAKEGEFRKFWSNIYEISEEENRDFCDETQTLVEDFLRQHKNEYSPYTNIDLSRLSALNSVTAPITLHEIKTVIKQFRNKKAPGFSKINKEILSKLPDNMLTNLLAILNASLSAGLFPGKFKLAIIKYIPKGGKSIVKVQNHRPISLLEAASKLYEKIINNRFRSYLEDHGHNNPRQHSYRQKRGTHTALALMYEEVAVSQRNKEQCNIVLRDVAKAFDKVYHAGLKYKICQLNLPRCFKALLCNFLDDRSARIQIGQHLGEEFQLKSGVPQGSCLSPTLYNLYVADLGELQNGTYIQYADDITQITRYPGKSKELCRRRTEAAIEEVNSFEKKWKVRTNKSKFLILHPSRTKPRNITQEGRNIPFAREARILGLKVNRTGIQPHIKDRRNLANAALTKIKRFRDMQARTKLHLYKAMVAPHLTYPPVPLNTMSRSNTLSLQAVQNKALRWINGDTPPYTTNIQTLHEKYNLQPINTRIHTAAVRVWETLRTHQEGEVIRLQEEDRGGTHNWWKSAYISEDATEPPPLYCATRQDQAIAEFSDDEAQ